MKKGKLWKRILSIASVCLLVLAALSGCNPGGEVSGDPSGTSGSSGASNDDVYKTTGKVKVAIPAYTYEETVEQIELFKEKYPGIEVEYISFEGDADQYLSAQQLVKDMPDILFEDWGNIPFYVSQGWLKPLNEYFEADSEKQYVPEDLIEQLTYGGNLYALPCKLEFEAVFMNMDLLNELNLDAPDYDWTVEEFEQLMRDATTTKTSGIEKLWGLDEKLAAGSVENGSLYGYDIATHTFNFTDSWVSAVNTFNELRAVPGLEAWSLRGEDNAGYIQKFGDGNVDDMDMAFKSGLVLCNSMVTSERGWMRFMPFEVDVYPIPYDSEVGEKIGVHANSSYMLEGCQDPEAAYQLLKWLTYGVEGQKLKLQTFLERDENDAGSGLLEYFSPSTHPELVQMLQESEKVLPGLKYLASHMDNVYRADLSKIVPNWETINSEIISPQTDRVRDGEAEAAAIASELDSRLNAEMEDIYSDFLAQIQ